MGQLKRKTTVELESEIYGGEIYEYLPLGKYIVASPRVCGGRPTIKYHRLDARHIIGFLKQGTSIEYLANNFEIPVEAVEEVIALQDEIDYEARYV
ncbi:MAG: DUF433 domain-containing protein [Pyrinomonadaceae bacterium]